ncbi:hypothetical protein ACIBTZ_32735 [Micromonospora sp. NPDC049460]|uniref:hypothetical protein n=1 Tax=Micromonospora sp. NPDC049460 TaxID=3364272 RepID=UPI0037956BBF
MEHRFHDRVTLIDAGEYTTRITCSRCDEDISLAWLGDLVRKNGGLRFDHLDVTVPCCRAMVELDSLRYEEPIGFARFEVSAMNPTRATYELDAEELAVVAGLLGHSLRRSSPTTEDKHRAGGGRSAMAGFYDPTHGLPGERGRQTERRMDALRQ